MDTMIGIQGFGQYDAARRELERLVEEFDYEKALPLGHQLISPLDGPWTKNMWSAFIKKNTTVGADWQLFAVLEGGHACSRFFGLGSVDSFIRLANKGMGVLKRISQMKQDRTVILPDGLVLRLPSSEGCDGWLQLLYQTAPEFLTPFLHAEPQYWGSTGQLSEEALSAVTTSDGVRFSTHPLYQELRYDLSESSAQAIQLWIDPYQAVQPDGPVPDPPVCLPPEPEENGPCLVNKFWLWGKCHEFSPKCWQLLDYLWGKGPIKKDDAMEHIYGRAGGDEIAFASTVKRLKAELGDKNCLAEVRTKEPYIWLEVFKQI